jgi:hypothetical protein
MPLLAKTGIRRVVNPPILIPKNFDDYKFSCHPLPKLILVGGYSDNELLRIYNKHIKGEETILQTPAILNGIEREQDSIELYNKLYGRFHVKNEQYYPSTHLHGTPDIVTPNWVIDVKTCMKSDTFDRITESKAYRAYWWQLVAYSYLTSKMNVSLVFTDLNTERIKKYDFKVIPADHELLMVHLMSMKELLNAHHESHQLPF